ncbi:hypothetical protein O181_004092 [Austropuccinia psidii MF-1]|uniref:Integrase catalytic domain-containing protein n=1 Tax=Austropuccinia psidii MF-1 TaxID=1389203 RepID=A0A9Q3BFK5_9BASI|nr:hypothetical protein [Austropuccinia psidii MF-1]
MEYKDHGGYTHDWVTLLPAVQLAYNTSQHSTTGKSPSLVEKGWNPQLSVDHLKKNLLSIHPKANKLYDMWKRPCDGASRFISEATEHNKQRWDRSHMEPDFKEGDRVLLATLNFKNLKGPKKMRESLVGPFIITKLIGKIQWKSYSQRNVLGNIATAMEITLLDSIWHTSAISILWQFGHILNQWPNWASHPFWVFMFISCLGPTWPFTIIRPLQAIICYWAHSGIFQSIGKIQPKTLYLAF